MQSLILLSTAIIVFLFAFRFYGRYLTSLFQIDIHRKTPAHERRDDIDYVPTKAPVLFGHHFASIAGAGPIVGPVLGVCFGWVPVALWIILGTVLIGAVHDFAALFVSVRNEGYSIGRIIERYIGYSGRQIFLLFCFAALILVVSIFALLIAKTFVASPSVATSSIYFVFLALIFGFLVYQHHLSLLIGSLIFLPLLFGGIQIGIQYPLDLVSLFHMTTQQAKNIWLVVLFIYVFIASVVPVWMLLQPRDYLNSYLLYSMILLGFISIIFVNPTIQMPAFSGLVVEEPTKGGVQWALFPILYVTVACGACSGFHALVASGTTAKQLDREAHILPIGYGAMLVEGIVAIMALISVAILTKEEFVTILSTKGAVYAFSSGLAGLASQLGIPQKTGNTLISLTISAFMLTTLDTATRLTRFTVQGLCIPKRKSQKRVGNLVRFLNNRFVATFIVVVLSGYLAFSGDAGKIWPVFGASNQLLAALTLLLITIILIKKRANYCVTFLPFLFMFIISFWAIIKLFWVNLKPLNWPLTISTIFLFVLSGLMIIQSVLRVMIWSKKTNSKIRV